MTTALIRQAADAGIQLFLEDGQVRYKGKPDAVNAYLPTLRQHKNDILNALQTVNEQPTTKPDSPPVDVGSKRPPGLSGKLLAASLELDRQIAASKLPATGPDAACWPHSHVMNSTELALMARRLDQGASDAQADSLMLRERLAHQVTTQLLAGLTASKAPPDQRRWDTAPIPAVNPETKTLKLNKSESVPVGSEAWHHQKGVHRRYMTHHWGCLVCIGAGQGRGDKCNTGAALWSACQTHIDGGAMSARPYSLSPCERLTNEHGYHQ